uniref:developmental pluripotency-associated protein 2 n=1 Tax=Myodes glareolus TaxID=447135 RepID=UPI0020206665|nr:developmental pluripotency-associated protein 2 [Myodes glareolus]
MSISGQDIYDQFKREFEEEIILTLVPATEDLSLEVPATESSATELKPAVFPTPASWDASPSVSKQNPHPSLPAILPPINEVSRNTLREWCRCHDLSTDGKKVEVYMRLQKCSYSKQECHIPQTSREARLRTVPKKPKPAIEGPSSRGVKRKKEENENVEVLTSERESVFAAWGRIAMRAAQPKAVNRQPLPSNANAFLPAVTGHRWCVVHGRQLPADKEGWVCLQLYAGHTWVPDSPQRMIPLFILPACVFPSPGVEDNMLCPECAHSNRKMMRNFERDKRTVKKHKLLPPNLPP